MPTVIAGQLTGLEIAVEKIVLNLIKYRWPHIKVGDLPALSSMSWSLMGYLGYGDYQVSIEPSSPPMVMPLTIGRDQIDRYADIVNIHLWVRKNDDTVPDSIHAITQKIQEIVKENVTNVGYGITSITMPMPFSPIEEREFFSRGGGGGSSLSFQNATEKSLWHTSASVELMYFLATTHIDGVSTTKIHKFNVIGKVMTIKTHKFNIQA